VKVIRQGDKYHLQLGKREKIVLFDLLELYPQIPPGHFQLSKAGEVPDPEANQRLLDEALAEQRTASKNQLHALLSDAERCQETQTGFRLRLSEGEVEWLLQVLNDIRIGSWIRLGSPQAKLEMARLKAETMPFFLAMEMAGTVQMALVSALTRRKS